MWTPVGILCSILAILPNNIELSSEPGSSTAPGSNHRPLIDLNNPPAESPPRTRSRSPAMNSSTRLHGPEESRYPFTRFSPPRSMAPSMRLPSSDGHGYGLEQLDFIRLVSMKDPHLIFKLQRYTFPHDKSLKLQTLGRARYQPMRTQEQIVLSTYDGDVFAILDSLDMLEGIYKNVKSGMRRVKINMERQTVARLTRDEVISAPVGAQRSIMANYRVYNVGLTLPN